MFATRKYKIGTLYYIVIFLFCSTVLIAKSTMLDVAGLVESADYDKALSALDSIDEVAEPIKPSILVLRARLLHKLDKASAAVEILDPMIKDCALDAPGGLAATVLLARIFYKQKRYARAARLFKAVIQRFPNHSQRYELRYLLAQSLKHSGKQRAAIEVYLALAESPLQKLPARKAFSSLYRQFVTDSFPRDIDHDLMLRFGRLLLRKRKFNRVLDVIHDMLYPAKTAAKAGKKKGAPAVFSAMTRARAHMLGGELELRRGNPWWARTLFVKASRFPVPSNLKANALYKAGDAMLRLRLYDKALYYYRKVLYSYGGTEWAPAALFQIANVAQKRGNGFRALANYRVLIRKYPDSWFASSVLWQMGRQLYRDKKFTEAEKCFADYCTRNPSSRLYTTVRYWQARALSCLGFSSRVGEALRDILKRPVPGFYHLAAAHYLKGKTRLYPRGLPTPAFDKYRDLLPFLSRTFEKRPADGWIDLSEVLSDDELEMVALLKEYRLWGSLCEELERLVHLKRSSGPLRIALAWSCEQAGDFQSSIEQAEIVLGRKDPFRDVPAAQVFDKAFPRPRLGVYRKYCGQFKVPLKLALAITREESHFSPELVSWAGAKGLMQIMNSTGRWIAKTIGIKRFRPDKLYWPNLNIRMGCWYLGHLGKRFTQHRDRLLLIIASYNAGPGNVCRWLKNFDDPGGFETFVETWHLEETRNYVKKVARSLICYELLDPDTQR